MLKPAFTRKRIPDDRTNVVLLVVVLVLVVRVLLFDFQCTEAFSFHKRSSLNFAHGLKTIFSTIAPCLFFKLINSKSFIQQIA